MKLRKCKICGTQYAGVTCPVCLDEWIFLFENMGEQIKKELKKRKEVNASN